MYVSTHRALIISNRNDWRKQVIPEVLKPDWDVYIVTSANEGKDLLTKKKFDLIIIDDSLHDMEPPEFCFTISDLTSNTPLVLVAGKEIQPYQRVWEVCDVHVAGTPDVVERELGAAVRKVENGRTLL